MWEPSVSNADRVYDMRWSWVSGVLAGAMAVGAFERQDWTLLVWAAIGCYGLFDARGANARTDRERALKARRDLRGG